MSREEAHACDADSEVKMPTERMPTPTATGPYREHRRDFVLWIASKANRFALKTLTIHYAANYLDRCVAPPTCTSRDRLPCKLLVQTHERN